jgi:hypothetical protein
MRKKMTPIALLLGLAVAGSAQGAVITFGSSNTIAPLTNATLSVPVGQTLTFYAWARTSDNTGNEAVNSLGLNIAGRSANGGAITANSYVIDNPGGTFAKRWSGTNLLGGLNNGGYLVNDARALTTSPTANSVINTPVVYATLTITGVAPGTVNLFVSPSPLTISETNTTSTVNNASNFGFGDAAVSNTAVGAESTLADAVVTVVAAPEPATVGVMGLGLTALGFARRRRA